MDMVRYSKIKNPREDPHIVEEVSHTENSETINTLQEFTSMVIFYNHANFGGIQQILLDYIKDHYTDCIIALARSEIQCAYSLSIISYCLKLKFQSRTKDAYYLEHYGKFFSRSVTKKIYKLWEKFPLKCPYLHSIFVSHKIGKFRELLSPLLCLSYCENSIVDDEFIDLLQKLRHFFPNAKTGKELFHLCFSHLKNSYLFVVIVNRKVEIVSFNYDNDLKSFEFRDPHVFCY